MGLLVGVFLESTDGQVIGSIEGINKRSTDGKVLDTIYLEK